MSRAPWFKCFPTALLGALAGMDPDEGYVYVTVLLRIYEVGGPIRDNARVLARRTGMTEKRVSVALESLSLTGKISIDAGLIDSDSTHENIADREKVINHAKKAGNSSAQKKAEKNKQNQENESTPVERPSNECPTIKNKIENNYTVTRADDAKPDPALIRDMQRRLFEAGGEALNRTAAGLEVVSTPLAWWKAGFDLDLDVLPVVRSACASAPPGRIRSWGYFTERIQEAHARRTAAIQPIAISEARASPSRRSSGPLSAVEVGLRMLQENERDQSDHASGILIDLGPAVASG